MSADYRTLAPAVAGVYAIQFPGHVKLGMSQHLRGRLRGHGKDGGTRARVWIAPGEEPLWRVEDDALAAAAFVGRQIRKTESFTRLTFGQAVDILRAVTTRHWGGPVHEVDGFTQHIVIPIPNPHTRSLYGWNGAHLLEVTA